jgi:rfaE bifunctional protein nucleotidyltransferase chain/domain
MSEILAGMLLDRAKAVALSEDLRLHGRHLVFTNGIFDILHAGHVAYLAAAREMGDFLLVGLNSDRSTRQLKGPHRPLVPAEDRAALLLALRAVNGVVIFDELTSSALIGALRPAVYVKGGDYGLSGSGPGRPLPEEPAVRAYGGEIRLIPYRGGYSTSELIARIRGTGEPASEGYASGSSIL